MEYYIIPQAFASENNNTVNEDGSIVLRFFELADGRYTVDMGVIEIFSQFDFTVFPKVALSTEDFKQSTLHLN